MKERLRIENFGGLKEAEIDINAINIYIGKQASGKSVSAKLIYFFKSIFYEVFNGVSEEETKVEIDKKIIAKFEDYFPPEAWVDCNFRVIYKTEDYEISVEKVKKDKLTLTYSDSLKSLISSYRKTFKNRKDSESDHSINYYRFRIQAQERFEAKIREIFGERASNAQVFVPAGRSFFANLQSAIYPLLRGNKSIDPFLLEFGTFYGNMKTIVERRQEETKKNGIDKIISNIIGGEYLREKDKDYIVHNDNRKINVAFASSGQQETLPLSIILKALTKINFNNDGVTVYIEEPEAHLFPSAQKNIVELIATVYNISDNKIQFFITTHSPYILTAFNNLFHAGLLIEQCKDDKLVNRIVPKSQRLNPKELSAYEMRDGKVVDIIDREFGLINAEFLDKASEDINKQFGELLEIE